MPNVTTGLKKWEHRIAAGHASQGAPAKTRLGTASLPSRSRFCPLFGCILVVDSSFFGRVDLFLSIELRLLNLHEGIRFQTLMSFERAFFQQAEKIGDMGFSL